METTGRLAGGDWNADAAPPLSFQKLELALVPLSAHGNFYEGDCYVILSVSTKPPGAPAPALGAAGPWVLPRCGTEQASV